MIYVTAVEAERPFS